MRPNLRPDWVSFMVNKKNQIFFSKFFFETDDLKIWTPPSHVDAQWKKKFFLWVFFIVHKLELGLDYGVACFWGSMRQTLRALTFQPSIMVKSGLLWKYLKCRVKSWVNLRHGKEHLKYYARPEKWRFMQQNTVTRRYIWSFTYDMTKRCGC